MVCWFGLDNGAYTLQLFFHSSVFSGLVCIYNQIHLHVYIIPKHMPCVLKHLGQLFWLILDIWVSEWMGTRSHAKLKRDGRSAPGFEKQYPENDKSVCNGILIEVSLSEATPHSVKWYINIWRFVGLIAMFMGPTWEPSGADRTQVGPMLAPWTLLSGKISLQNITGNCVNTLLKNVSL